MSNTLVDPDMFTRPFQLTKGIHRDVYDTINPGNPSLRAIGKVVIITRAGGGLEYMFGVYIFACESYESCG